MLAFLPGRVLLPLCLLTTAACSSGTTGGYGGGNDDAGTPTPTPTATGTTPPPPDKPDGSTPTPDAGPVIDKTVHFDLTLDGDPIPITTVTVKLAPASGSTPASIAIAGQYEQQLGHGLTSTATFTVNAGVTEKGTDACGTGGRYASYLFKDTDGTIRIVGTSLQGGSCTMKIFSNAADDFTSGSATGVIGGLTPKAFTIAWGQPIPKT